MTFIAFLPKVLNTYSLCPYGCITTQSGWIVSGGLISLANVDSVCVAVSNTTMGSPLAIVPCVIYSRAPSGEIAINSQRGTGVPRLMMGIPVPSVFVVRLTGYRMLGIVLPRV